MVSHKSSVSFNLEVRVPLYYRKDGDKMSHVTRKPVFGVYDQVRLKLACSATEAS